ncbi:MAG: diguanylate cyclase [Acidimicrobiales bacterium]|nr:diguanylate cyclase [Acidimicrobiales bacterium]
MTDVAEHEGEAPAVGPLALGVGELDQILAKAADVTLLFDASTGTALRRWHEGPRGALDVPDEPAERAIGWVHPDDVTQVLDVMARTAFDGERRTTIARTHPDKDFAPGQSLLMTAHDVQHVVDAGLLVQVWLVDLDALPHAAHEPGSVMSSLAAAAPVGLQVRSGNGNVSFENDRFTELAGPARAELDRAIDLALGSPAECIEDVETGERFLRLRVVSTFDRAGNFVLAVASLEDVTSLRRAEEGRAEAEGLFRAVFDNSPVATAVVDLDGRFAQVNESLAVICGYAPEELVGRHFADITHPDDLATDQELLAEVVAGTRSSYQLEKRYLHSAGHQLWVDLTVAGVRDARGQLSHLIAHIADITSRKAALDVADSSEDLAHWATHDHLTGLPNRRYLDNVLATSFGPRRRAEDSFAVLFLDLDDFKPVNDAHGHQVGDDVLRILARRLRNACRDDTLVARYGGDEFVVVTRRLRTVHDLSMLVERILSAVRTPIVGLTDHPIRVGTSVGVASAAPGERPGDVVGRADAATYRAKSAGKDRAEFAST